MERPVTWAAQDDEGGLVEEADQHDVFMHCGLGGGSVAGADRFHDLAVTFQRRPAVLSGRVRPRPELGNPAA
jgi:hypothetical protein